MCYRGANIVRHVQVSRKSIDAVKDYFKEDLTKADWRLMLKFKALFEIL